MVDRFAVYTVEGVFVPLSYSIFSSKEVQLHDPPPPSEKAIWVPCRWEYEEIVYRGLNLGGGDDYVEDADFDRALDILQNSLLGPQGREVIVIDKEEAPDMLGCIQFKVKEFVNHRSPNNLDCYGLFVLCLSRHIAVLEGCYVVVGNRVHSLYEEGLESTFNLYDGFPDQVLSEE